MNISETTENNVDIVSLKGRLDAYYAKEVETKLQALFKEGKTRLVLDLKDVEYVSRSGLRVILAALKKVRADQGDIKLAQMNSFVREVFEISGFSTLFQVFDTEREAADSFGP